ncbi:hypothetical protein [Streptomyces sp. NPDC047070]|uniref:hypothetical protein n=1 Tax=Streptomyces sp. NPDC047070 TaxID=3154923 RepID=UPI003456B79A
MSADVFARRRAIRAAAVQLAAGVAQRESMTPAEAARAAYYPGHPLGSERAIEAHIKADRERRQQPASRAA